MKKIKISWEIVFVSAIITALLIILFTGFLIAEKNTQKTGFTIVEPFFTFTDNKTEKFVKLKYMGKSLKLDFYPLYKFTEIISKFVYDCLISMKENFSLLFNK